MTLVNDVGTALGIAPTCEVVVMKHIASGRQLMSQRRRTEAKSRSMPGAAGMDQFLICHQNSTVVDAVFKLGKYLLPRLDAYVAGGVS